MTNMTLWSYVCIIACLMFRESLLPNFNVGVVFSILVKEVPFPLRWVSDRDRPRPIPNQPFPNQPS